MNWGKYLYACMTVFVAAWYLTASSSNVDKGSIKGKVFDSESRLPISAVNVIIQGTTMGGMTLDDGSFLIIGIPAGIHSVKASTPGYNPAIQDSVIIRNKQTINITFYLDFADSVGIEDYTRGKSPICEIHNIEMNKSIVFVGQHIELLKGDEKKLYEEARMNLFPNAEPWYIISSEHSSDYRHYDINLRKAILYRCPKCVQARKEWLDNNENIQYQLPE